jgi:hypothetical protein
MPFGIGGGHMGGHDYSRMRAEYHHRQNKIKERQRELDQHHNIAHAEAEGERHRSPFVIRVLRRLLGRF